MRRLLHSLSGQLLALLLLALALAHVIAVAVMSWSEGVRVHPLAVRAIAAQVATAYRLTQADALDTDTAFKALDSTEARFARAPDAPATALDAQRQQTALIDAIRHSLDLPDTVPVHVALHSSSADGGDAPAWWIDIALALPDGQWLAARHHPAMMHPHWDRVLRFSFVASALAIMLIAVFFGRSVMRPLRALAHAARRISRGETLPPLPEQGPAGVREITRAFNDMQARLGRFVADRTRMIAAIGHDLRTPLTSLRIRTELIEDESLRASMRATLDDMALMAQESLYFARDDAALEPTTSVDLPGLINEVVEHQRVLGHTVAWRAPEGQHPPPYACRPLHLKRALNNLLDNAVRYGNAEIHLKHDAAGNHITVQDDGPGIAADQLERVFEPFARLDASRNLENGSAGLGLAIARSFVHAHGGEIHLRNRPEGGLCAEITLPR